MGREAGVFKKSGDASGVFCREAGLGLGNFGGSNLADADGFTVEVFSVFGNGLETVAEGVAKVQYSAQAGFFFILPNDFSFDLAAASNDGRKGSRVLLQQLGQFALEAGEEFGIVNDAVFDDLRKAGAKLSLGQSA